jgi:hypothetical protein
MAVVDRIKQVEQPWLELSNINRNSIFTHSCAVQARRFWNQILNRLCLLPSISISASIFILVTLQVFDFFIIAYNNTRLCASHSFFFLQFCSLFSRLAECFFLHCTLHMHGWLIFLVQQKQIYSSWAININHFKLSILQCSFDGFHCIAWDFQWIAI